MADARESSFFDKSQNNSVGLALYEQKKTSTFCDVIMKVCGREIQAHSNVLAAASPYFHTFLSQDLPRQFSQRSPQIIEIQIDGSEPSMFYEEAVDCVIDYIYTGKVDITVSNVSQICEIAKIMQIHSIVNFCERLLPQGSREGDAPSASVEGADESESTEAEELVVDCGVNTDMCLVNSPSDIYLHSPWTSLHTSWTSLHTSSTGPQNTMQQRFKPGKLVSVSCQVTPMLLGIEPPRPKQTKEEKTQTYSKELNMKRFTDKSTVPKRKRGRPPKSKSLETREVADDFPQILEEFVAAIESVESEMESIPTPEAEPANGEGSVEVVGVQETPLPGVEHEMFSPRRSRRTPKPTEKIQAAIKHRHSSSGDEAGLDKKPKVGATVSKEVMFMMPSHPEGTTLSSTANHETDLSGNVEENKDAIVLSSPTTENTNTGECPDSHPVEDTTGIAGEDTNEKAPVVPIEVVPIVRSKAKRYDVVLHCEHCEFQTTRVRQMNNHQKLHRLEENICFYCELKFDSRDIVNEHMEKHKGPLPHFCQVCGVRFKNRTQLNIHLPKHSDEKPFACHLCPSRFKWKHALKGHMITHSNVKDHLCDICGYATAHKSQLKAHHLIHTGQTYKCNFPGCQFEATKTQNLKYHMLTHTREKPHQCEFCGQAFSLVKNLRRHMLLHNAGKVHQCLECEFRSTRLDKLKEHQLKQHGLGTPPEKRVRISDLIHQNHVIMVKSEKTDDEEEETRQVDPSAPVPSETSSVPAGEAQEIPANYSLVNLDTAEQVTTLADVPISMSGQIVSADTFVEASSLNLLPGQTVILTQPLPEHGHEATATLVPIPITQQAAVESIDGITYTEVVLPSQQISDLVQVEWKDQSMPDALQ